MKIEAQIVIQEIGWSLNTKDAFPMISVKGLVLDNDLHQLPMEQRELLVKELKDKLTCKLKCYLVLEDK
jgi:hypothetical protein